MRVSVCTSLNLALNLLLLLSGASGLTRNHTPRRHFLSVTTTAPLAVFVATPPPVAHAASESDLLKDVTNARALLKALPALVGDGAWDPVRTELRKPSINALWNVNDSANSLRKLATLRGDPEIIEAAEDIARNLRDVDQIVYSNSFSMEGKMAGAGLRTDGGAVGRAGEGGGKYRVKEPQDLLKAAVLSIDGILAAAAAGD